MHRERVIYLVIIVSLVLVTAAVTVALVRSEMVQEKFRVMESCDSTCINGPCCADNAGSVSFQTRPHPVDSRISVAVIVVLAITAIELAILARRR